MEHLYSRRCSFSKQGDITINKWQIYTRGDVVLDL